MTLGGGCELSMHSDKVIPYSHLLNRLRGLACFKNDKFGATSAVKRTIKNLVDQGDIVEVLQGNLEREKPYRAILEVKFLHGFFGGYPRGDCITYLQTLISFISHENTGIAIIGNIHQNPELLEEK